MVLILSPAQLISTLPTQSFFPFHSKAELVWHLLFVLNNKERHGCILKSTDNQSFCALIYRKNTRSALQAHFDIDLEKHPEIVVTCRTDNVDTYFKGLNFEFAPFFTI